jgi:hypothetical protein
LRQLKPFPAPSDSQPACLKCVASLTARRFFVAQCRPATLSTTLAITKSFVGDYGETFEDNILTFIRKLFTSEKSSIKPAFYSPSKLNSRKKKSNHLAA